MSDSLKDLEIELRDVIIALKDVAGTQWYDLGLQLRLSPSTLDTIASDHQTSNDCKRTMLRKWLKSDPEASWEKLAAALTLVGHESTAAAIRSKFSPISSDLIQKEASSGSKEEDTIRLTLTRKNLNKIKGQFSSLLVEVQSALKSRQVSVEKVRSFLVHYSSRDDWIQNPSNLDELFTALSVAKLWNYDHYDLLEEITKRLLPNDVNVKKLIVEYKGQLTGFYTTTKMTDFIKLSDFEDSEQDPQQSLPVDTYTFKDYRKLKMKLKLDRKISSITLTYIDELWRSLAEEFDLPCLTAVIHSIIEGSLVVTWLILPHIAKKIIANRPKATKFFRGHGIVLVMLDNDILYDEEKMIKYEKWLFKICSEGDGDAAILSKLKNRGVDFNESDNNGYTPLCLASYSGNSNVVRILLENGAHVNKHSNDEWGITPLMAACWKGRISIAKILVENGATVDLLNKAGQSPLFVASGYGQRAAVRFLIENGADVNLPADNASGYSALTVACLGGFVEIVRLLLEHGAVVDYQDKKGDSALSVSSAKGHIEVVKELLKFGAQVNLQTSDAVDVTSLTIACVNGHIQCAQLLIEYGAVVDIIDKEGWTAIFYAARKGYVHIVQLLMDHGADLELKDKDGLTAYDIASINSHPDVCRLMEAYGYMAHRSATTETRSDTGLQTRHCCDEITSVQTFRAILESGSGQSLDEASRKHQTSQMFEESEEKL